MKTWGYFKWGAKHHPGNPFYVIMFFSTLLAALKNENIVPGLIAVVAVDICLLGLYVATSISVGKANKNLIEKEKV